jgi:hypothetical protein
LGIGKPTGLITHELLGRGPPPAAFAHLAFYCNF